MPEAFHPTPLHREIPATSDGFYEKPANTQDPKRCIDERLDFPTSQQSSSQQETIGNQYPGGTAYLAIIWALDQGWSIAPGTLTVIDDMTLKPLGYKSGGHRGAHSDEHAQEVMQQLQNGEELHQSGCGFFDNLPAIIAIASKDAKHAIEQRLTASYNQNPPLQEFLRAQAGIMSEESWQQILTTAFEKLASYTDTRHTKIELASEPLAKRMEGKGAHMQLLTGPHNGQKRFINLVPGVTFNTETAAKNGDPAFNFDLADFTATIGVLRQNGFSAISTPDAIALSLILYEATSDALGLTEPDAPTRMPVIHA